MSEHPLQALLLGYAVLKTGSVWVAVILHIASNQSDIFLSALGYTPLDAFYSFGSGIYGLVLGAVVVALLLRDPVWRLQGKHVVGQQRL